MNCKAVQNDLLICVVDDSGNAGRVVTMCHGMHCRERGGLYTCMSSDTDKVISTHPGIYVL